MNMHEGSLLRHYLKSKRIEVKHLAKLLDMSRQNMYLVFGKETIPNNQRQLILKKLKVNDKDIFIEKNDSYKDRLISHKEIIEELSMNKQKIDLLQRQYDFLLEEIKMLDKKKQDKKELIT